MSEVPSQFVKRGFWINLAKGDVMGRTITTDTKTGTVIVALLAACVTIASRHMWHLVTFAIHQSRANGRASDGLYRQQQALLRTQPSPSTLMIDSMRLFFVWRKTSNSASNLRNSFAQSIAALLFTSALLAASVFSSFIVDGSNIEVMVQSPFCGHANSKLLKNVSQKYQGYMEKVWTDATQYVSECYGEATTPPEGCNIFVRPRIPIKTESTTCPFKDSMCISEGVALDSGYLDLNDHFGLNLKHDEGMKYRKRVQCAVLSLENRTSVIPAEVIPPKFTYREPWPQEEYMAFHYGSIPGTEGTPVANMIGTISLLNANISSTFGTSSKTYRQNTTNFDNSWVPIDELVKNDADVILTIVAKGKMIYVTQVDDPLFAAHKPKQIIDEQSLDEITVYLSDAPAAVLGCTEQFQFCLFNSSVGERCTKLGGLPATQPENVAELAPFANAFQVETLRLLLSVAWSGAFGATRKLQTGALAETRLSIQGLPKDQWVREVKSLAALDWANAQLRISDYAVGPKVRDPGEEKYYEFPPSSDAARELCGKQKMRKSGGFVNINVFGLSFILTISVFIALLDITLLRFLIFVNKVRKVLSPRIDRWIQDGVFQLQRRVYEFRGEGEWKRLKKDIPLTVDPTPLPDLPVVTFEVEIQNSVALQTDATTSPKIEMTSAAESSDENAGRSRDSNSAEEGNADVTTNASITQTRDTIESPVSPMSPTALVTERTNTGEV